jgi:hypothetical protein
MTIRAVAASGYSYSSAEDTRYGSNKYTTLVAALSASSAGDDIEILGTWSAAETSAKTISVQVTITALGDARHPGHSQGTTTHYRASSTSGHCFTVNVSGVVLNGLDIEQAGTGTSDECVRMAADTGTLTIKNSLIWASNKTSDQDGVYAGLISCTVNIENCIAWGFGRAGFHYQGYSAGSYVQTWNLNSCTAWNCETHSAGDSDGGCFCTYSFSNVGAAYLYNCCFVDGPDTYGSSDSINIYPTASPDTYDVDRCLYGGVSAGIDITDSLAARSATDSDTPGTGDWVVFNDITSAIPDLRLKSNTENDAQDAHVDSSGLNSMSMPSTDIAGTSRPQNTNYDIGAFEIVVGGTTYQGTATDGFDIGEAIINVAAFQAVGSDGLSLGEVRGALGVFQSVTGDGLTLSDLSATLAALLAEAADGVVISDGSISEVKIVLTATDGLSFSGFSATRAGFTASASDGATLNDAATTLAQLLATAADGIRPSDLASLGSTIQALCVDGASFGASLSNIMSFAAVCADVFNLGDIAVHILASGVVSVTFSASKATVTFGVKKPTVTFGAKKPTVTFTVKG